MALETPVVDLEYKRGDSKPIVFVLKDKATGNPLDLTGYTLPVLSVHNTKDPTDITTELFKIDGAGATIPAPVTDGKIQFIPAEDATGSDQTPETYFYDAQVLDAAGNKCTFVEGAFKITQDKAKD